MAKEKNYPTLKELLVGSLGETKSAEEILDTFKLCSRKGVTIVLDPSNVYILDKVDFSRKQLDMAEQYMKNGAKVCERKKGRWKGVAAYEYLYSYFRHRIDEKRGKIWRD